MPTGGARKRRPVRGSQKPRVGSESIEWVTYMTDSWRETREDGRNVRGVTPEKAGFQVQGQAGAGGG